MTSFYEEEITELDRIIAEFDSADPEVRERPGVQRMQRDLLDHRARLVEELEWVKDGNPDDAFIATELNHIEMVPQDSWGLMTRFLALPEAIQLAIADRLVSTEGLRRLSDRQRPVEILRRVREADLIGALKDKMAALNE